MDRRRRSNAIAPPPLLNYSLMVELTQLPVNDTRTPCTSDFDGSDGDKQARYLLRWLNNRRETGSRNEMATATIGA